MAKEDWKQIDELALNNSIGEDEGADVWALYQASKTAYREYKRQRDVFEIAMNMAFAEKLPAGYELKFGYNFGKLSIAVGPVTERKAAKAQDAGSLTDWLSTQAANGDRC